VAPDDTEISTNKKITKKPFRCYYSINWQQCCEWLKEWTIDVLLVLFYNFYTQNYMRSDDKGIERMAGKTIQDVG
jgi:hypothetical protein